MNKKLTLLVLYFVSNILYAQNVGINAIGLSPNASSMLDVSSTNSGLLLPRMSAAQRDAIVNPATGLLVFVNNDNTFYYYNGTLWVPLFGDNAGWKTLGNTGMVATSNFLGTSDAVDLVLRTNNTERLRISSNGNIGIGATAISEKLEVFADTDNSARIGRAFIGFFGFPDYAGFGHIDHVGLGFAFGQMNDGTTLINTPTGKLIHFGINAGTQVTIGSTGMSIGSGSPARAQLEVLGSLSMKRTISVSNYTIGLNDYYIAVTSLTSPRTITLPLVSINLIGRIYIIKDETGNAGTNNITVSGGGANIDGSVNQIIATNYGSIKVICDGTNWFIIN